MTAFTPNLVWAHVAPGTTRSRDLWIRHLSAAGALTFRIEGADPLVEVGTVVVSKSFRRRMTRAEIEELPAFPPEIRESARRHGIVEDTMELRQGTGAAPVAVGTGQVIKVELICTAPAGAAAHWQLGRLVAEVDGVPVGEVPLYVAVGAGDHEPLVEPEDIDVAMEPGETASGFVSVAKAPSATELRAFLTGGSPVARSVETVVSRAERLSYQEAERLGLLDGMSPRELERVRREGFLDFHEVDRAANTNSVKVLRHDQVTVLVAFAAPEDWGGVVDAKLALVSPGWTPVEIDVQAIVEDVSVTLASDTFTIGQGDSVNLGVTVSSGLGAGGEVTFHIQGYDTILSVPEIHLAYEPMAHRTISLPLKVAPTAPLGPVLWTDLVASFHGGVTSRYADLNVTVVPGSTTVWTSPLSLGVQTGGSGQLMVAAVSGGGHKTIRLTPAALPPGVTVESGTLELDPLGTQKTVPLRVDVHADRARPAIRLPLGIDWVANDGAQRGTAVSELTVIQRPETRTFTHSVVTPSAMPLGGRAEFVINSDGSGRFKGFMEATGLLSYDFCIRGVLRSANGLVATMAQESGSVYGWDTPGDARHNWDQDVSDPRIQAFWPDLRTGTMTVTRSSELAGVIGGAAELAGDILEFAVTSSLLLPLGPGGQCLAGLVFVGNQTGTIADGSIIGVGGLSGLAAAGGAAFLLGPHMIIPAFVGGALAGEALVDNRRLRPAERALAESVFKNTLPWDRIVLTNLSGQDGQAFVTPSDDGTILVNLGVAFEDPLTSVDPPKGYGEPGQIFIHELTHAWQIGHKAFPSEYFWKAALDKMGGSASYRYGPAGPPWREFGIEAQASIVDQWYAGSTTKSVGGFPPNFARSKRSEDDPYFRYIADNIRLGEP
ncbi:hypothetical protein QFZ24_002538 [Streptomyces phaeochromogenes]|uniref:hypothetical protein n=1 Tax=Streptomyces phaeochromogenes TaxID=1923 RepID=UPI002790D437|nr:hypothetical protein [Streptomyces phaeochromogenes]MDQ0948615.1 hypothetical protein [Streptomyces phaeochromogenes]